MFMSRWGQLLKRRQISTAVAYQRRVVKRVLLMNCWLTLNSAGLWVLTVICVDEGKLYFVITHAGYVAASVG